MRINERNKIEVSLKLCGGFKKRLPEEAQGEVVILFFQERVTIGNLLNVINIPPEDKMAICINCANIMEEGDILNQELNDGDRVAILPPILVSD